MIKYAIGAFTSVLLAAGAMAADLPMRGTVQPDPPLLPPLVDDWTGFYIGAHAGFSASKVRKSEAGCGACGINPLLALNPTLNGFVGGALAGYNYQIGNLVVGIEGDIGASSASKGANVGNLGGDFYSAFANRWGGHIRARFGYAFGSTLAYAAAGYGFSNWRVDDTGPGWPESTKTLSGWTIGGGIEHKISQNLSLRGEYLYSKYSQASLLFVDPNGCCNYTTFIKPDTHTFRIGLSYYFNEPSVPYTPVIAKY